MIKLEHTKCLNLACLLTNDVEVIPILYEDAHNQDPPVVPPWQGGTTGG
jgi:hypothetical protein